MSDKAGILQTARDICVYIVATPLGLTSGVIIVGALLDLVIFPDHNYGIILILSVIGLVLSYTLGFLVLHDFREWRKQQRRAGR